MGPEDPNGVHLVEALPETVRRSEQRPRDGRKLAEVAVVRQFDELDLGRQGNVLAELTGIGAAEEQQRAEAGADRGQEDPDEGEVGGVGCDPGALRGLEDSVDGVDVDAEPIAVESRASVVHGQSLRR